MSHNFSAYEQLDWNANLNPLFLFLLILGQSSQLQGNTIATRPWRLNSFSTVAGIYRRPSDKPVPFRRKVFLLTLRVSRGKSFGGLCTPWQWLEGNATNVGWVNRTRRWISTTTSWLGDYRVPTTSHNITQHPVSMSWMSVHRAIPWQSSSTNCHFRQNNAMRFWGIPHFETKNYLIGWYRLYCSHSILFVLS
jgi:hypothetical protein